MAKIVNLDGSAARSDKSIEDLTSDPKLFKLGNCSSAPELEALWLGREVDREDVQVALLFQLVGSIQQLSKAIGVLLGKLEIVTKKTDTRVN